MAGFHQSVYMYSMLPRKIPGRIVLTASVYINILNFMEITTTVTIMPNIQRFFDSEKGGLLQSLLFKF